MQEIVFAGKYGSLVDSVRYGAIRCIEIVENNRTEFQEQNKEVISCPDVNSIFILKRALEKYGHRQQ